MRVELKKYEVYMAAEVGIRRHLISMDSPVSNMVGNKNYNWKTHIDAACAELSVAKALNIYWDGSVNKFKKDGPDLPPDIEVRTTEHANGHLILRDGDKNFCNEWRFVLVVGEAPVFKLIGWIYCHEGILLGKEMDDDKDWSSWWISQDNLRPISEMPERGSRSIKI